MSVNRQVYKFELFSAEDNSGDIIYTEFYIDLSQFEIIKFVIPVGEDGEKKTDLIKVFMYHKTTFEPSEMIVKCTDIVIDLLNDFIKDGVTQ